MSNAGFYFAGTDQQEDKVICYSCGLEKSDWKLNSTDPWLVIRHQFRIILLNSLFILIFKG